MRSEEAAAGGPGSARVGGEIEAPLDGLRAIRQAGWVLRFPWLVQGVTARELDFAGRDTRAEPWERLRRAARMTRVARIRQVHGSRVLQATEVPAGVADPPEGDALAGAEPGLLLAITVADCVPVFAIDPHRRALGLAHAGWRGAAAGVVAALLERMESDLGAARADLHVHLGPAICGGCYEIGPEVAAAFGLPAGSRRLDLRGWLESTLRRAGIAADRISRSELCTRCDGDRLLSYRGGDRTARMCAFLGAVDS